jgi:hypothetical protein
MLLQRVRALQRVVTEQAQQAETFQRETQSINDRANRAEATLSVSILRVQEMEQKSRELAAEADKMRLIAGGITGVAIGLTVGLSIGASGPGVALYAAGGGAVGLGAACVYNCAKREN